MALWHYFEVIFESPDPNVTPFDGGAEQFAKEL